MVDGISSAAAPGRRPVQQRENIAFPGTEIAAELTPIAAIAGHSGIPQSLRPRQPRPGESQDPAVNVSA
jgi:hypothetical protein